MKEKIVSVRFTQKGGNHTRVYVKTADGRTHHLSNVDAGKALPKKEDLIGKTIMEALNVKL